MFLGIEYNTGLVYERTINASIGFGVWPNPILIPANVVSGSQAILEPAPANKFKQGSLLFREEAFDPVSRIRRGRFYISASASIQSWQVGPHPLKPYENDQFKDVLTYSSYSIQHMITSLGSAQPLVILGSEKNITIWLLVSIETTATSDELITLRMRQSFGALPRIREEAIPSSGKDKVISAIGILSEDIHRAGPESVIDRAREAVTAILTCYLQSESLAKPGEDLFELTKSLDKLEAKRKKNIVFHASNIVRLFHSRGKTAEQEKRQLPPLREQDAELAVQCVGTILRDLGWAQWELV